MEKIKDQKDNHKIKPKKCRVCRSDFTPSQPMQVVCGINCAKALAQKKREKAQQSEAKAERKRIRERKEALKTRQQWIREAQTAFNQFIKLRDQNKPCIACGTPASFIRGNKSDAGHYIPAGRGTALRFDERNVHKECVICNRHLSGNLIEYRKRLIQRIGLEAVEELESRSHDVKRWSIDELRAIKTAYKAKLKELQSADHHIQSR